jgi:hypothetical protein
MNKKLVCILLGISPASDCGLPTFRNPLSVPSSRAGCETDRGFRNVGKPHSDAGEIPKRIHTRFKTRRKDEIKNKKLVCRKYVVGKTAGMSSREPAIKSQFQLSCPELRHGIVLDKPTVM